MTQEHLQSAHLFSLWIGGHHVAVSLDSCGSWGAMTDRCRDFETKCHSSHLRVYAGEGKCGDNLYNTGLSWAIRMPAALRSSYRCRPEDRAHVPRTVFTARQLFSFPDSSLSPPHFQLGDSATSRRDIVADRAKRSNRKETGPGFSKLTRGT